ncbi:DNA gyrase inhibitor YacG [Sphingomonas sp. PR090111-T3T-6A]|uniref:DNA gyrase inhibitor YacG n=1 Tax=Sphingomonas sp. PR090111-T3T-6A TaxID=685778 RepID=UPI0003825165|nr:DNA gyrase inhibitor YacG [Sphingomonas sp. PR090111-T3T-6A]
MSKPESPARRADRCPICGKPSVAAHAPFCSQGCRDRDLLQWLGEGYRMPGRAAEFADEED